MFPSTFGIAFILVGVIWVAQGFGLVNTGSVMDRDPLWGWLGLGMVAAGAVMLVVDRRKKRR